MDYYAWYCYYPWLLFHGGTSDTDKSNPKTITKDYTALGAVVKDSGIQAVFLLILQVKGPVEICKINGYRSGATARAHKNGITGNKSAWKTNRS